MHDIIKRLKNAGIDVSNDIIGIWCDRNEKNFYVILGDWVDEKTAQIIKVTIPGNVEIEAETTPDKSDYPITIKAINPTNTGVVFVLKPDANSVKKIQQVVYGSFDDEGSVSAEEYHLTLKYLGKVEDKALDLKALINILTEYAYVFCALDAKVGGVGRFLQDEGNGTNAVYLSIDSTDLGPIHDRICEWLLDRGVFVESTHGFTPHITVGYIKTFKQTPDIQFNPFKITFDEVSLWFGDTQIDLPLSRMEDVILVAPKAVWDTSYINDLPDSAFLYIETGGKKDSEGKTIPRSKRHFPYKDSSGKIDLPHLRNAIARIPQSNALELNKDALQSRARRLLGSSGGTSSKSIDTSNSGSLTVFKQKNGKLRWVLFSSNPYRDRDGEYVTQIAHEQDIEVLDRDGYKGQVLRLWHMGEPYFEVPGDWTTVKAGPGADIGECDFAAMHGRIRIESGTFYSEEDGEAIAAHADELESSLAFAHPKSEPDPGGGFLHIKSFERSLTPRNMASNLFTSLMVGKEKTVMDPKKLQAFKDLGVDIENVLDRAGKVQKKADKTAPYRMKSQQVVVDDELEEETDNGDLVSKIDRLYEQLNAIQTTMKEGDGPAEPEEKFDDLQVKELTVGELRDLLVEAIRTKSAEPTGQALKAIWESIEEVKEILTSKSVQSVVEDVARLKAKMERHTARLKAVGSKVRDLDEDRPAAVRRGVRPSENDLTLLDEDDELAQKSNTGASPFSWIDDFIQKDNVRQQ